MSVDYNSYLPRNVLAVQYTLVNNECPTMDISYKNVVKRPFVPFIPYQSLVPGRPGAESGDCGRSAPGLRNNPPARPECRCGDRRLASRAELRRPLSS